MKTKDDLIKTYILCYNEKDWERIKLIINSYFSFPMRYGIKFPWHFSSKYQYIVILNNYSIGWDTSESNSLIKHTKDLKEILIEDLFKYF